MRQFQKLLTKQQQLTLFFKKKQTKNSQLFISNLLKTNIVLQTRQNIKI